MLGSLQAFAIPPAFFNVRPSVSALQQKGEKVVFFSAKGLFGHEDLETCGKLIKPNVYEAVRLAAFRISLAHN